MQMEEQGPYLKASQACIARSVGDEHAIKVLHDIEAFPEGHSSTSLGSTVALRS